MNVAIMGGVKTSKKVIKVILLLGLGALIFFAAYYKAYWSPANTFTIVDSDTGLPVQGVIVVAKWPVYSTSWSGSGVPVDSLALFEVVSDENGVVEIPAWDKKYVNLWNRRVVNSAPEIYIFKIGYEYRMLLNMGKNMAFEERKKSRSSLISEWNGKTVKLTRFTGTDQEYAKHIKHLAYSMRNLEFSGCVGKVAQKMIHTINQMSDYFQSKPFSRDLEFHVQKLHWYCAEE